MISSVVIDIAFVGIGENGHLAFNDPPYADFDDPEDVRVIFRMGAGCYGVNGADTVSYDAALMSQALGRPVNALARVSGDFVPREESDRAGWVVGADAWEGIRRGVAP